MPLYDKVRAFRTEGFFVSNMHKIVIAVTGQQQSELARIATTLQTTPETLAYLIIQEWMGSAHGDPAEEFQIMSLREYEHRQGEVTEWRKEDWI